MKYNSKYTLWKKNVILFVVYRKCLIFRYDCGRKMPYKTKIK